MAKSAFGGLGRALCLGVVLLGCKAPEDNKEPVTEKKSALVVNLFSPSVAYPTGSTAEAVAIGDLDGDGRNDIAMTTSFMADPANDRMLNVFIQASDGTLRPRVQYPLGGAWPRSLDIGDVNGDGRADVVVGNEFGAATSIQVLLQNASGTLDPFVSYPTPNGARVKVGDFNGDGRMDVAGLQKGNDGNGLDIFLQTDTGTLAAPVTYVVPHAGFGGLDAGDVNGDGRLDLVVMSTALFAIPGVSVLLQNADGTMAAPVPYSAVSNVNLGGMAVGDTNGDGRADVVVSYGDDAPNAFIARFLQNGQGTLNPAVAYPSWHSPGSIVVADVDPDGRKDVLVLHNSGISLGIYRQTAAGDFRLWPQEIPPGPPTLEQLYTVPLGGFWQPQALAVGDINSDGLPDVVVAGGTSGLAVLRHTTDLEPTVAMTAPTPGTYLAGVPITVSWTASDDALGFVVNASFDGGVNYQVPVCNSLPATARSCTWSNHTMARAGVRIRVQTGDAAGNQASAETIIDLVNPTVTVTAPAAGAQWTGGTPATITWTSNLSPSDTVRVELSRNNGATFETLAAAAPNTGSFTWTVAGPDTSAARVRLTTNTPIPWANTSGTFQIFTPVLTVTGPAAGANAYIGIPLTVTWTSNLPPSTNLRIEVSSDGGASYQTLISSWPNTGTFTGTPIALASTNARVRLTTLATPTVSATSGVFSFVTPILTMISPVAGAGMFVGAPLAITWSHNFPTATSMRVELSRDGGGSFTTLAAAAPDTGSFGWTVTGPDTAGARLRLTANGTSPPVVTQSGAFAIVTPAVAVTSPVAGTAALAGAPVAITWTHNLPGVATALIELSRDGGASFETLAAAAPNTGSFGWIASGPDTAGALARVTLNGPPVVSGVSGVFGVATPVLTVTSPAAGASFFAGTSQAITWSTNLPASATMNIELSRDGGGTFETVAAGAPNTGSFAWTVTGPDTATALVRVSGSDPVAASGTSGVFGIVSPALAVTGPTAGASWLVGTAQAITWTSNLPGSATVLIELSRDGGASYATLAASAPNSGSFALTAAGPTTSSAVVRVSASSPATASGTSGVFSIANAALAVTAPATGASWTIGTARSITWSTNLPPTGTVRIELSRNNGTSYTTLAASAPNSGSFAWTATGPATTSARVRLTANGTPSASAVSGNFSLVSAAVTVTSPNTLVTWLVGSVHAITWTHNVGAGAQFKIEVSRNSGSTWSLISAAAPAGGATSGSFNWTVAAPRSDTSRIRVTWTGNTAVNDASNVNFRIR